MKMLILGSGGLLGSYLLKSVQNEGYNIITLNRNSAADYNVDASDINLLETVISKGRPDIVINAIKAKMSTGECEERKDKAWKANVIVPTNLAKLSRKYSFRLVHYSSDWVFEGRKGGVYSEDSITYPVNFYGYTKAIAEENVKLISNNYIILRVTGLFGYEWPARNFLSRVYAAYKEGKNVKAPTDQFSQPISAKEVARITKELIEKNVLGLYHCVSDEYLSRYELAKEFIDIFEWNVNLEKITSNERSIRIPKYLRLDNSKLRNYIKIKTLKEQITDLKLEGLFK